MLITLLLIVLLSCTATSAGSSRGNVDVDVEMSNSSILRGKRVESVYNGRVTSGETFLGVPFAKPPVGDLRWGDPQPAQAWDGIQQAVDFAPGCIQSCTLPLFIGACPKNQSEDCLYLNIFTPPAVVEKAQEAERTGVSFAPLPVMVFIHGGAFTQGAGGCDLYYGLFLANVTNQIIVTINYRLTGFGFLVTPELNGNYGLKDQRFALQWVRDNIQKFGGNPNSVTIFGESAGGMSVGVHLVSPLSAGLFHKAIMESNPISECTTYDSALDNGASFAKAVKCDPSDTKCLRALSADTVLAQSSGLTWEATIDGTVGGQQLPDYPINLFRSGKFTHVPTILGTNANEDALLVAWIFERPMNASEYTKIIELSYPKDFLKVLALYPAKDNYDNRITYGSLLTHQTWSCPGAQLILDVNKWNPPASPGYIYYFEHVPSFPTWREPLCLEAVCHAEELPFVFDTISFASKGFFNMTPEEQVLSKTIGMFWGQLSATGNPSVPNQPTWPAFLPSANISMVLDTPAVYASPGHLQKCCNFWDTLASSTPFSQRYRYLLNKKRQAQVSKLKEEEIKA